MTATHIFTHSAEALESQRQALVGLLDGAVQDSAIMLGEVAITIDCAQIETVLTKLRDFADYQQLMDITAVDWPDKLPRFQMVYNLLSLTKNERVRISFGADEDTPVASVQHIYPIANWLEREVFDMYGLLFTGHPDLRRILTDYGFEGHPQRKDFPLTGYTEVRYDTVQRRVVYEPVQLPQDFRAFDFSSPWEAMTTVQQQGSILPGDEKAQGAGAAPFAPRVMPTPAQPNPATLRPRGYDQTQADHAGQGDES